MRFRITELRGLGPQIVKKLHKAHIYYAHDLKTNLAELSEKTGIKISLLERFQAYVNLMAIRQIGPACANLLCRPEIGITNLQSLAKADPDILHAQLVQINKKYRIAKLPPNIFKVRNWIWQAIVLRIESEENNGKPNGN